MAVRGIYSKEEEAMLAEWRERIGKMVGWVGEPPVNSRGRVVTEESIERVAIAADYWNPLYRNEAYARNTRWGGIIAPPFYFYSIVTLASYFLLTPPPEVGKVKQYSFGDYWTLFKPVRIGDKFRVWLGFPDLDDVTPLDGKSPRMFRGLGKTLYINQRDEVAAILSRLNHYLIVPPGTDPNDYTSGAERTLFDLKNIQLAKNSVYTDEDLATIDRIADSEVIRGATPRYWEDVQVDDELTPIIQGPITIMDNLATFGINSHRPMREMLKEGGNLVVDPETNIRHSPVEWHFTKEGQIRYAEYSSSIFEVVISFFFGRLTTNWMGDDGFLLKQNQRKFHNTPYTDTIIGKGKVAKKYIGENGEHLVDLNLWMESSRGCISNVATSTVSLPSREKALAWSG